MIPRMAIGESELLAVPALHNRCVFAEQVNRVCRDITTRPEAVAVELSHDAVAAVVEWFKELGVGPGSGGSIPCMLGVAKANSRIHPRYKEAAIRLQELHGVPVEQLPPEILRRELNFAPVSLLCLSVTDSMIEAIRSAMEHDLPIYGVDIGEVAQAERRQPITEDPLLAQGDLAAYVQRNESLCVDHRDLLVDARRELVIAARLKCLLRRHSRVLFTGGLGHWQPLCERLCDQTLSPSVEPVHNEGERFDRVVVAPSLAVQQMDVFPEMTVRYESLRRLPPDDPGRLIDFEAIYRRLLSLVHECAEPSERYGFATFTQYLMNISLVQQCRVPDLFTILGAANATISPAFAMRLSDLLVSKALDWAKPHQWPNLPYLDGTPTDGSEGRFSDQGPQGELEMNGKRSARFFLSHLNGSESRRIDRPLLTPANKGGNRDSDGSILSSWVWPPCETLLFGVAYQAAEIAERNHRGRYPEPFSGSLQEGVDIKATLRAATRGERTVHVKVATEAKRMVTVEQGHSEPTVFVFERRHSIKNGRWDTLLAGSSWQIRKYVRNSARFDRITRQKGCDFVANVHYCVDREPPELLRKHVEHLRYVYGMVVFGNPSLNTMQSARWLEERDYDCCPILHLDSPRLLFDYFRKEHQLELDSKDWVSSLIQIAVPFAKERVTVLVPSGEVLPSSAIRAANARQITLDVVSLSEFPPDRIERIRHQYLVCPSDAEARTYSEEMQAAFGESPNRYLELLPQRIRAQLEPPSGQ
jgi:hypothetical protein